MSKRIIQLTAIDVSMVTLLTPLNRALKEQGYEVHLVCSAGDYVKDFYEDGFQLHEVNITRNIAPLKNLRSIIELVKIFKRVNPDIIHVHTPVAAVLGRIAAKLSGMPNIVYTAHGFYFHEGMPLKKYLFYFYIEKYVGRYFTDYIFTQSIEDYKIARKFKFLKNESNHIHIGNGVDIEKTFRYDSFNSKIAEEIRQKHNINEENLIVTFIGILEKEKGILDFINSYEKLTNKNVTFIIIGGLPEGERDVETYQKLSKLKNPNIILTGHIDNVNQYLYTSDVFCLPSYREGMPRSIIEAMTMKNAILATNIRGSREEVVHGKTGYLFEKYDSEAIAFYIDKINNDRELLKQLQEASYNRALLMYDERKVLEKQLEIFSKFE